MQEDMKNSDVYTNIMSPECSNNNSLINHNGNINGISLITENNNNKFINKNYSNSSIESMDQVNFLF